MVHAPPTYEKHEAESCWTHDYLLRHCEQYRVESRDGRLGYVEEVVVSADESEPIGFLVRDDHGLFFVSTGQIRDFSPRTARIVVDRPRAALSRGPAGRTEEGSTR